MPLSGPFAHGSLQIRVNLDAPSEREWKRGCDGGEPAVQAVQGEQREIARGSRAAVSARGQGVARGAKALAAARESHPAILSAS